MSSFRSHRDGGSGSHQHRSIGNSKAPLVPPPRQSRPSESAIGSQQYQRNVGSSSSKAPSVSAHRSSESGLGRDSDRHLRRREAGPPASVRRAPSPHSARRAMSPPSTRRGMSPPSARRAPSPPSARRAPSSPSTRRAPSPISTRRAPSPISARRAPSPISTRRAPSPISTRRAPSPISTRRAPSPISTRRAPSPISTRRAPSPISARRAPSPQSGRRAPSSPSVRRTPSSSQRHEESGRRLVSTSTSKKSESPHLARKSASKPKTSDFKGPSVGYSSKSTHNASSPSRVRLEAKKESEIIRRILSPDTVKIPRRPGEGGKPIFERDELRESIKKRMKSGDNEANPETIEQRVVAIIREPVIIDPYASSSSSRKHASQTDSRGPPASDRDNDRRTTASGLSYRHRPESPNTLPPDLYAARRTLSEERLALERERYELERAKERSGRQDTARDNARSDFNSVRYENRSRSRSPLDRVRRINLSTRAATPPAASSQGPSFARGQRERDLRETLNRGQAKSTLPVPRRQVMDSGSAFRPRTTYRGFPRRGRFGGVGSRLRGRLQ